MSESNPPVDITVLRLGHRIGRDPRISTHVGLVARAFGADIFLIAGDEDPKLMQNIRDLNVRFGGPMRVEHSSSPLGWLRRFARHDAGAGEAGVAVHLTMYGEPFREVIPKIPRDRPLAVVVGGAKVPGEIYDICQFNVAVGNQPHSEVAALGLFLDAWHEGVDLSPRFTDGRLEVHPSASGKIVSDSESEE